MPLSILNAQQRQAACAPLGANLVIASAGTGKTSTIVGRIAFLLQKGIPPEKILLLTFTNKAAQEMIDRLVRYFSEAKVRRIEAGTFHAVAYRWLKEKKSHISLKQPAQLRTLFRGVYQKRDFLRMQGEVAPFSASFLYERYSLWQNASREPFGDWFLADYPDHEPYMDAYADIIEEFEAQKRLYGFVSFNDLLLEAIEMMQSEPVCYSEVLVDEYQDTNTLQSRFIDAIQTQSLFCVGDYDQSIYAFNGADIANIATFSKRYPHARIHTLKVNYRSSAPILSLADRVICNNERLYPKSLEVGKKSNSQAPMLLVYQDLYEQYRSIAHKIKTTHTPREEIAVLFRNNASADGIEAALRELNVSCKRKGGVSFFETKEIKFLLDFISLSINEKDMMAFIHLLEYASGVGTALAKELFEHLIRLGDGSFYEGLIAPKRHDLFLGKKRSSVQLALFEEELTLASASRFAHLDLTETLRSHPILKHPKLGAEGAVYLDAFLKAYIACRSKQFAFDKLQTLMGSELFGRIVETLSSARARLKTGEVDEEKKKRAADRIRRKSALLLELAKPYRDAERFLNAMVLGGGELSEGEGVNLLTVHAAKGLEFEEVYVVDLVEGRFPNHKMMTSIEEERRLFYVAVTRAKSKLFLSYARYDAHKKRDYEASRFLKEAGLIK